MQESILIKEAMKYTSIDLLLFDNLRLLKVPKCDYKILYSLVNLIWCSLEDLLKVLIFRWGLLTRGGSDGRIFHL